MSSFEHTVASFRAALISGAQRNATDELRAMLDDGYAAVPRDLTRSIRSAAMSVALTRSCEHGCEDAVLVLLQHGAEHSRANGRGDTPLHVAAEAGHLRCVEALLAAGADLTARNGDGKTPIAMSRHPATRAAISAEATRRRNGTAASSAGGDGDGDGGGSGGGGGGGDADARADGAARVGASRATRPAREWRAASTPPPIAVASSTAIDRGSPWGRSPAANASSPLSPLSPNNAARSSIGQDRAGTPAGTPLHRIRSRLRDDLRCAVCLRDFCSEGESSSPVTLPCGHSFCRECVGGMRGSGANTRPFRCPLDRAMVSGNLDLRVNATMRDLIRLVGRKLTVEGRTPVKEGGVENGTAVGDESDLRPPGSPAAQLARRPTFAEVCSPMPR